MFGESKWQAQTLQTALLFPTVNLAVFFDADGNSCEFERSSGMLLKVATMAATKTETSQAHHKAN